MKNTILTLLLCCVASISLYATHNRAGEITYRQIGPLTIEATITTYTKTSSTAADRPSLDLYWGDGSFTTVDRTTETILPRDIKRNTYVSTHTYPGNSTYLINVTDPNRNANILNVNFPFSDQVVFFLQTEVKFLDLQFQGPNSSPILLQPPVDIGCVGQIFQHTPNAYDPDGDSIAYELVSPLQAVNQTVPNYFFVDQVPVSPNNNYTFNTQTGLFTWNSPQQAGEYNIAMIIKSYRNGVQIGTILRDMQIEIFDCNNRPPVLELPADLCVVAGTRISFQVRATDADAGQNVTITASGGPLEINNSPATITNLANPDNPASVRFVWETDCSHIREQYYQVVFKAEDNGSGSAGGLATFGIVRIRVVGPPATNLTATNINGQVQVCWTGGVCDNSPLFQGYTVWRRQGCSEFTPNLCTPDNLGSATNGFVALNSTPITSPTSPPSGYCFTDTNLQGGLFFQYIVQATYAPLSDGGFIYNPVGGIPSNDTCIQLQQDIPLMLNADVRNTDAVNGQVFMRWTKPKATDLDTIANPGPYVYRLYRKDGFTGADVQIFQSTPRQFYYQANDTVFIENGLNTVQNAHNYKIEFFINTATSLGATQTASTVYLNVAPSDESNSLSWESQVPWGNYSYVIFREGLITPGVYDSLTTVIDTFYKDENLTNGVSYCYVIKAIGTYNIVPLPDSLINFSQKVCATPRDNVPPCPPTLTIQGCDINDAQSTTAQLFNRLTWDGITDCRRDLERYRIYYATSSAGPFQPVGEIIRGEPLLFDHTPSLDNLSGCYYLTAIDSVESGLPIPSGGNESAPSDTVCTDNCPLYNLPNAFTPNGDGANETFRPFNPYRYIESINFRVFNRWGQQVFESKDPAIGWNGRDQSTDKLVPDGVYFYTCDVFERRLAGSYRRPTQLSGYIQIVSGTN